MFTCKRCKKELRSQNKYNEHITDQICLYPWEKTYCSVCELLFESNKELLRHKLTQYHMDELNSRYDLSENDLNDIFNKKKEINLEIIKKQSDLPTPHHYSKQTKENLPEVIVENIVEYNEPQQASDNDEPESDSDNAENENEAINNEPLSPIIIKLNQISRNANLDKLMINFLTQCNILDYQTIYSYIISENTEIEKNIRVRMIKLILYFRKLLLKQLNIGHLTIQNKPIKKIIEILNNLFK